MTSYEIEALQRENAALRAELAELRAARAVSDTAHAAMAAEVGGLTRLTDYFLQAPFPLGIFRGPDHRIEIANPAVLHVWGKDASVVGLPLVEATPEVRDQPFLRYLDDVFRTGVTYEGRGELYRLRRSDGTHLETYFDIIYSALRLRDGTIHGILFVGIDVTARVLAEKQRDDLRVALEQQEHYFRDLVDNLPQLAWTATPDGAVEFFNRRWYEYTGTTSERMKNWGLSSDRSSLYEASSVDEILARWTHSLATGDEFEMEYRIRGVDGQYRWFLTRIRPLRDASGTIVRWFGTNIDIDERRRGEGFRETFLGILGHDLRNPLTTILTTARLLRMRKNMGPEHHPQLERMVRSGTRMERMIGQLLDITRARLAGGIPVHPSKEAVDLPAMVGRIVDEVIGANADTGRVIQVAVVGPCKAHVDPDRFEQVVSNLIGNAVAHGDPSAPIRVELVQGDVELRLSVTNSGKPIPPDFLPHLFNPFARLEKPDGPSAGLGLGLYISERIVFAHHGRLVVHSDAETGTRFDVLLPREVSK